MEAVEEEKEVGVDGGKGIHDRKIVVLVSVAKIVILLQIVHLFKISLFLQSHLQPIQSRKFKEMKTHENGKLKQLLSSTMTKEFIRFAIVGVVATGIHYGVYLLLLRWMKVNVAYSFGYVFSLCCNLLLTSFFTFRERITWKKTAGFLASHGVNYVLHIVFLNLFLYLGITEQWAPIPVYCIVIPINFILVRTAFKKL